MLPYCGFVHGTACGRQVAQRAVRGAMIIELAPRLDQGPSFTQIPEPLPVQALIAQLTVKAIYEAVMPRLARRNESRTDIAIPQPFHHPCRGELGPLVGADMLRLAIQPHQARVRQDDIAGGLWRGDLNRQTLPGMPSSTHSIQIVRLPARRSCTKS